MTDLIVVGGGAAGLAAGAAAAACGDSVLILERMDRVGKKLLATGNGRCNLMNRGPLRYPGGSAAAQAVLAVCGAAEQEAFWRRIGLRLREEAEGRVYPVSGQAATVLDALRFQLDASGVRVECGREVRAAERRTDGWSVTCADGSRWPGRRLLVAGGGKAQPKLGSNGSAYALLGAAGHRLTAAMEPSLTQLETETAPIRALAGIRVKCAVTVEGPRGAVHRESGELLFTEYGLSGVCVMQCSRFARAGDTLAVDLAAGMGFEGEEAVRAELRRRREGWHGRPAEQLLTGLCVPRLSAALMRAAGIRPQGLTCADLDDRRLEALAAVLRRFPLRVTGLRGFDTAQVTAGGVSPEEFDLRTMASKRCPGLFAAGEVLDVDGLCGGYNLMFAFGSGILAGLNGRKAPWEEPV